MVSSYGPGPRWKGARKLLGYGANMSPLVYCELWLVTSDRSVEALAVRYVPSPWYWPRKVRIIGRPVDSRASLTPVSTASVPLGDGLNRVMPSGAMDMSLAASSISGRFGM